MTSPGWIAVGAVLTVVSGPLVAPRALDGEGPGDPLSLSLKRMFDRAADHMLRVAELAPAELYGYRPSPQSRSLGEQVAHTADVMYQLCAVAAGTESPADGSVERTTRTKAEILVGLEQARGYCDVVFASMTDARAVQTIDAGPKVPRFEVLVNAVGHIRQHIGNVRAYLWVNGIEPPAIERVPEAKKPTA